MFNIAVWIRETIFRRQKLTKSIADRYFKEKRIAKIRYPLLICVFLITLSAILWGLPSMIDKLPIAPVYPSRCISDILIEFDEPTTTDSTYSYNQHDDCILIGTYPSYDVTDVYNSLGPRHKDIQALQADMAEKMHTYSRLESLINGQKVENNSWENNLSNTTKTLQNSIQTNQENLAKLNQIIENYQKKIRAKQDESRSQSQKLKQLYEKAVSDYIDIYFWYRAGIMLLSLLFSVVIFFVFYRFYTRN